MEPTLKSYTIKIDTQKYSTIRQNFHRIPEIGYKEFKTKSLILETLNSIESFKPYSNQIKEIGDTGFYFDIYGTKEISSESSQNSQNSQNTNYLLALRADIDGLPFKEENEVEYKSQHENMIHGCGHDGHITILLATIDYYLSNLQKIPKSFGVRFLFQPAEEGLNGALQMIQGGCLEKVNEIYGLHNVTTFNLGEIGVIPGTIMAKIQLFEINIKGKGGHSSTPHKCCSPINTGVQIISAINQISSQEIDSQERNVIGIGSFQSGSTFNVIPETGVIKGTIRSLKNEIGDEIINRIKNVSESIAHMNKSEVVVNTNVLGNCTVNHSEPANLIQKIAGKYFKVETHDLPLMASEDFSYFMEKTPGCFFMLGVKDDNHKEYLHTPTYDFNDKGIPYGVEMFIRIIEEKSNAGLI
jgi:amidohydrolase